jgi:hypothetical protein
VPHAVISYGCVNTVTIRFDLKALGSTKWYEYLIRFLAGAAITVVTGIVAEQFGPAAGGLFLAFPAIFPAAASLIEKHETERKLRAGLSDRRRGRKAAALDAPGAALGCAGLAAFGYVVWTLTRGWGAWVALLAAMAAWLLVSAALWFIRKRRRQILRYFGPLFSLRNPLRT